MIIIYYILAILSYSRNWTAGVRVSGGRNMPEESVSIKNSSILHIDNMCNAVCSGLDGKTRF